MKKLEDIEKEYEEFTDFKPSKDIHEFFAYVMVGIDDLDEDAKYYRKELRENKLWQLEAKIRNFLFFIFQEEDVEFYRYDDEILQDVLALCGSQRSFYEKILVSGNPDNYQELKKLVDFSADYYNKHMDYFESRRDCIDAYMRGFQLYINHEDNRDVFQEFLKKKMKPFENVPLNKGRQYVKVVRADERFK